MATIVTQNFMSLSMQGEVNLTTDVIKAVLLSGFTMDRETIKEYADISAYELTTVNGYTAGGQAVSGKAVSVNDVTFYAKFVCNSIQWTASGGNITADHCVLIDDTITDDPIFMVIDFGGAITAVDGQPLVVPTPEADFNC